MLVGSREAELHGILMEYLHSSFPAVVFPADTTTTTSTNASAHTNNTNKSTALNTMVIDPPPVDLLYRPINVTNTNTNIHDIPITTYPVNSSMNTDIVPALPSSLLIEKQSNPELGPSLGSSQAPSQPGMLIGPDSDIFHYYQGEEYPGEYVDPITGIPECRYDPIMPSGLYENNPGHGFPSGPGRGFPHGPGRGFPPGPGRGFPPHGFPPGPGRGFAPGPGHGFPPGPGHGFPPGPDHGFPPGPGRGFPPGSGRGFSGRFGGRGPRPLYGEPDNDIMKPPTW